ncbi:MAG: glutathione synthase [Cellvibrionales bacterium]|jgi:glutathione synthase|nr:glutathione synthase [Cellvibrionales bacterium]MBT5923174.1 glutathione synthase [Cellvibrionales bacterium]
MSIKLGIVMDPIDSIKPYKDSSLAMLLAAQERGWELHYFLQENLLIDNGIAQGYGQPLTVTDSEENWFTLSDPTLIPLGDLDVILMRKDPPFDSQFLYSTFILESAEKLGTLVVNKPQSLRDCNEKVFATDFPQCCPPVLITANAERIRSFHKDHSDIILKPLDGMGGASIFRVKPNDPNLSVIIETLTQHGTQSLMAQRYIPEITQGDKRILLIDGVPVPFALARIPAAGETRGNLAAGGRGEAQPLTERDYWICEQVAPTLRAKGLLFVGIDVIGDYLTEINVTSPTCIRELDKQCDLNIAGQLMDCINEKLHAKSNE